MKKICFYITLFCTLFSCEMRDELRKETEDGDAVGAVYLDLNIEGSRSTSLPAVNLNEFIIQVLNRQDAVVREYQYSELAAKDYLIELPVGDYKLVSASYKGGIRQVSEKPYYGSEKNFSVAENEIVSLKDTCTLQNVVIDLSYSEEFLEVMSEYSIVFNNGTGGIATLTQDDTHLLFFKVSPSIEVNIKGTSKEGKKLNTTRTIPDNGSNITLQEGYLFEVVLGIDDLEVGLEPDPDENTYFNIIIDITLHDREETIKIPRPGDEYGTDPKIKGIMPYTFYFNNMELLPNQDVDVKVIISTPNGLRNLIVEIKADSEAFLDLLQDMGLRDPFDVVNPGDGLTYQNLLELGLLEPDQSIEGVTTHLFDITRFVAMLAMLNVEGNYYFTLKVFDNEGLTDEGTLVITMIEEVN